MHELFAYSSTEWLNSNPRNWATAPFGYVFAERNEKTDAIDGSELSVSKLGVVPQLEGVAKSKSTEGRKTVCQGDFAFNSRSDRKGSGGLSEYTGTCSTVNIVFYPIKRIEPRYYHYLLRSTNFSEEFYKWGHGITSDVWSTRWNDLSKIVLPLPPLETQRRIADYLDQECARIDELLLLLKEVQRSSYDRLQKELDLSFADLVDIVPLHFLAKVRGRIGFKGYSQADIVEEISEDSAVSIGGTNISNRGFLEFKNLTYISKEKYDESPEIMLKGYEVLVTKVGAGCGDAAIYKGEFERATINPNVMIVTDFGEKLLPDYLSCFLNSSSIKRQIKTKAEESGAQPAINQSFLKQMKIPLPSLKDQERIIRNAQRSREYQSYLDSIIKNLQVLLEVRRQSLISAVVTGQKEV